MAVGTPVSPTAAGAEAVADGKRHSSQRAALVRCLFECVHRLAMLTMVAHACSATLLWCSRRVLGGPLAVAGLALCGALPVVANLALVATWLWQARVRNSAAAALLSVPWDRAIWNWVTLGLSMAALPVMLLPQRGAAAGSRPGHGGGRRGGGANVAPADTAGASPHRISTNEHGSEGDSRAPLPTTLELRISALTAAVSQSAAVGAARMAPGDVDGQVSFPSWRRTSPPRHHSSGLQRLVIAASQCEMQLQSSYPPPHHHPNHPRPMHVRRRSAATHTSAGWWLAPWLRHSCCNCPCLWSC
jgi:hypothetical protein